MHRHFRQYLVVSQYKLIIRRCTLTVVVLQEYETKPDEYGLGKNVDVYHLDVLLYAPITKSSVLGADSYDQTIDFLKGDVDNVELLNKLSKVHGVRDLIIEILHIEGVESIAVSPYHIEASIAIAFNPNAIRLAVFNLLRDLVHMKQEIISYIPSKKTEGNTIMLIIENNRIANLKYGKIDFNKLDAVVTTKNTSRKKIKAGVRS